MSRPGLVGIRQPAVPSGATIANRSSSKVMIACSLPPAGIEGIVTTSCSTPSASVRYAGPFTPRETSSSTIRTFCSGQLVGTGSVA